MIYAYDKWTPMPTKDLFDTQMMLASVNAAKDMYEKGLEEMKEFNEMYGDFTTPIASHMQWINDKVLDPTRIAINNLYANGIDPLRSREGRALLSRLHNSIDLGKMAIIKQSAKNAEKYKTSVDKLRGEGLYDADYEAWRLGGRTLDNWDADGGSPTLWEETSAMPLRDIDSIVEPWVKNLQPSYDPDYTKAQNDGYDYDTVSLDRIRAVIDDALPEFSKTSEGGYYRELANRAAGGDPIVGDAILKMWMTNRASDHTQVKRTLNKEREMALEDYYDARQTNRQAAKEISVYEQKKQIDAKWAAAGGDGSGGDGTQTYDPLLRVFQDAVGNVFGGNYQDYQHGQLMPDGTTIPSDQEKNILSTQKAIAQWAGGDRKKFINRLSSKGSNAITFNIFAGAADAMDRRNKDNSSILCTENDIPRIVTESKLLSHTAGSGFANFPIDVEGMTSRWFGANIREDNVQNLEIQPTGTVYGALMDDGVFRTYAKVRVINTDTGSTTMAWYDLDNSSGKAADYQNGPAVLTPDPNDLSVRTRSRRIAYEDFKEKPTSDDLELIPQTTRVNQ